MIAAPRATRMGTGILPRMQSPSRAESQELPHLRPPYAEPSGPRNHDLPETALGVSPTGLWAKASRDARPLLLREASTRAAAPSPWAERARSAARLTEGESTQRS